MNRKRIYRLFKDVKKRAKIASVREEKHELHGNERRRHNRVNMASIRYEESGAAKYSRSKAKKENGRECCRFFQGPNFSSDDYLHIGKMEKEDVYCGALHFFDESVKPSSASHQCLMLLANMACSSILRSLKHQQFSDGF